MSDGKGQTTPGQYRARPPLSFQETPGVMSHQHMTGGGRDGHVPTAPRAPERVISGSFDCLDRCDRMAPIRAPRTQMVLDKATHHPYDHLMLSRDGIPLPPRIVDPCRSTFWRLISLVLAAALAFAIWVAGLALQARDVNWCSCAYLDHAGQRATERANEMYYANLTLSAYIKEMEHQPRFHPRGRPLVADPVSP